MRLEKISSDCKNILGLSYWHVYTTFAMGREAIFKKSGKSMHPTVQYIVLKIIYIAILLNNILKSNIFSLSATIF